MRLDELDAAIVRVLLLDARRSLRAVAREVGSTPTTVGERLRHLEAAGLVAGATLRLDPRRMPGRVRLVRGGVRDDRRAGLLAVAGGLRGVTETIATPAGRFFAVVAVRDLEDEERVLAALRGAGAEDLVVESVERGYGPAPVHLFESPVAVAEPCAVCGRDTTDPLVERVDGRRVAFCCASCRSIYEERYAETARRAGAFGR